MSFLESSDFENEWLVLDKVFAVGHALGNHAEVESKKNKEEITLRAKDLSIS